MREPVAFPADPDRLREDIALRRRDAEAAAAGLPALLADAEHLAATQVLGEHGRRRSGVGDEFWQYRPSIPGDEARMIDWRRSGRSDQHFVREREWQAAQSVMLWVDGAQSMQFSGASQRPEKAARARIIALALAILLVRGGERVGLSGSTPPRAGLGQVERIAMALGTPAAQEDYGAPQGQQLAPQSRAVFLSDFLGDVDAVEAALTAAADRGVKGALLQILDPVEEAFPFDGRTIFESMGGGLRHETLKAGDLRDRYLERLALRRARLSQIAAATGWHFSSHHTGVAAQPALLWLYRALERVR